MPLETPASPLPGEKIHRFHLVRHGSGLDWYETALMHAVRHGSVEAVTALLAAGAKPNIANSDGKAALMIAVTQWNPMW